jgi:GNAT superfamily N-acetyltransferase
LYSEYAQKCSSNNVYPSSIVEGVQDGDIIPNNTDNVKAVLFWHYSGFAYLSGDVSEAFLQKIYEDYYQTKSERRFILITDDENVVKYFEGKNGVEFDRRVEYRFDNLQQSELKCDYRIERINENNYDKIQGRIIPSFSWSSKEQFLEKGFGYVALDGDEVIAIAFSAAVSSEEIDIGVETDEHYRHKGLAKALADKMCREVLSVGKKPVWAHAVSNEGSKNTALSVGFVEERVNTLFWSTLRRRSRFRLRN